MATDNEPPADVDAPPRSGLDIPLDASEDEAAAIVAAVSAHLASVEAAAVAAAENDRETKSWSGMKWTMSGRTERLQSRNARIPTDAPRSPWSAITRSSRW